MDRTAKQVAACIARWRETFSILVASGRSDSHVLALIGTELFFKDSVQRALEYAAWALLSLLWPDRAERVSIGISQVQVRHWRNAGLISSSGPRLSTIALFLDPKANYDSAAAYLRMNGVTRHSTLREIARTYRGEVRTYHMKVLAACMEQVTEGSLLNAQLAKTPQSCATRKLSVGNGPSPQGF